MNESDRLQRKRAFHNALAVSTDDEYESDNGLQESANILRPKSDQTVAAQKRRSASATTASADRNDRSDVMSSNAGCSHVPDMIGTSSLAVLENAQSEVMPAEMSAISKPPPSAVPKMKGRASSIAFLKTVREDQQIFRGLYLFFFPNNDTDLARRLKITKALEYGANWQKDYNKFVTHIILDGGLSYQELLSFLRLDRLPDEVVVVNDLWRSECIKFKTLIKPEPQRFRPLGLPAPTTSPVQQQVQAVVTSSSLQLKPAGKDVQAQPPSTPRSSPQQQMTQQSEVPSSEFAVSNKPEIAHEEDQQAPHKTAAEAEFESAISQAKEMIWLPFDDEEDPDERPVSSGSTSSEDAAADDPKEGKKRNWYNAFQCMQRHTGQGKGGPNAATIAVLQQMSEYYQQISDEWRVRAYRMAIASLRNHPTWISTREQAITLPKVGPRLADKIEEIAMTHRLRRLENTLLEPVEHSLQTFLRIYGVGHKQAMKWIQQGYHTIDDLLTKAHLGCKQRIGLEHYDDFNLRIPRAEVKKHAMVVEAALRHIDPAFELIVGGSYRRGADSSSDIDCIITHPTIAFAQIRTAVLSIIDSLTKTEFLRAELAELEAKDGSKWHGASCLPGSKTWRRIDFLLVPADELGAAKIYFTGNDIFNRSIRLLASKKGMRLNQHGLYKDVIRGKNRQRVTEGTLLEGRDEEKIFEILGVPWREPHERIVS